MLKSLATRGKRSNVLILAVVSVFCLVVFHYWTSGSPTPAHRIFSDAPKSTIPEHEAASEPAPEPEPAASSFAHPIDRLVDRADQEFRRRLGRGTKGVAEAAAAYRRRRRRHPPPRFDQYVQWCEENGVVMLEDFFDTLYRDLAPFWGVEPRLMRDFPRSWQSKISIRDGKTHRWSDEVNNWSDWMGLWDSAIQRLPLQNMPDVDLAFNNVDEPKIYVPWDTVDRALRKADADLQSHTSTVAAAKQKLATDYTAYGPLPTKRPTPAEQTAFRWSDIPLNTPIWETGKLCCPEGMARSALADMNTSHPVHFPDPRHLYGHMTDGFVSNWTVAKSSCENPHLRSMHGSWLALDHRGEGLDHVGDGLDTKEIITDLVPLLSGCKISGINSDILVPAAVHWSSPDKPTGFAFKEETRLAWEDKEDKVFWRGAASGGVNNATNWTRMQRHRFLIAVNGTQAGAHERVRDQLPPEYVPGGEPRLPHNVPLPDRAVYPLSYLNAAAPGDALAAWLNPIADAAFTHLFCWPPSSYFENLPNCSYNSQYFTLAPRLDPSALLRHKYLPDVDGVSFSGRFRTLLASNSLPLKATIYDEWFDDRLLAWHDFVPVDNTFADVYGLVEYFLGYDPTAAEGVHAPQRARVGHDAVARRIAAQGADAAATVVRVEDQLAWIYRLILEMARLSDDRRLDMGYAGDLESRGGER